MSFRQIAVPQQCPDREGDVSVHIPKGSHGYPQCCQTALAHTRAVNCGIGTQAHICSQPGMALLQEGPLQLPHFGNFTPGESLSSVSPEPLPAQPGMASAVAVPCVPGSVLCLGSLGQLCPTAPSCGSGQCLPTALPSPNPPVQADPQLSLRKAAGLTMLVMSAVPRWAVLLTLPPSVQHIAPCPWPLPLPSQPCCQPTSCTHPRFPHHRALQPQETLL